jgi:8-oxo-dGTP diphosphatase
MAEAKISPMRGVVAVILRGERFLVIQRSQFVRAPLMHCFPGGAIERDESESEALQRELLEELSLISQPRRLLWQSRTAWNVDLAWWLVEIDPQAVPVPNPQEVAAVYWLTGAEIRILPQLLSSNAEFLDVWERGECFTSRESGG